MNPAIADRGSHLEMLTGATRLRRSEFIDALTRATTAYGAKPILVICDDPKGEVSLEDAYRIGVAIAARVPQQRVAIALRGRKASEADYFTELVAANRGAEVRCFDNVPAATAWLVR